MTLGDTADDAGKGRPRDTAEQDKDTAELGQIATSVLHACTISPKAIVSDSHHPQLRCAGYPHSGPRLAFKPAGSFRARRGRRGRQGRRGVEPGGGEELVAKYCKVRAGDGPGDKRQPLPPARGFTRGTGGGGRMEGGGGRVEGGGWGLLDCDSSR